MTTKNKLKPIKFYTTEEILRWNRKRKPLKPKRNKPQRVVLGKVIAYWVNGALVLQEFNGSSFKSVGFLTNDLARKMFGIKSDTANPEIKLIAEIIP